MIRYTPNQKAFKQRLNKKLNTSKKINSVLNKRGGIKL